MRCNTIQLAILAINFPMC